MQNGLGLPTTATATVIAFFAAATLLAPSAEARPLNLRDGEGGVLFSYEQPDFGRWRPLATFEFVEIDPQTGAILDEGEDKSVTPQIKDWPAVRGRLEPGSYLLQHIHLYAGASSAYCFANETVRFDVREGEVTYLGHLTFEPAGGPPGGLANAVLGNNGYWHGRLVRGEGDRGRAEEALPELFRGVSSLNEAVPEVAIFPVHGRGRREVGRFCAEAQMME